MKIFKFLLSICATVRVTTSNNENISPPSCLKLITRQLTYSLHSVSGGDVAACAADRCSVGLVGQHLKIQDLMLLQAAKLCPVTEI